jgi:hypothetical protein
LSPWDSCGRYSYPPQILVYLEFCILLYIIFPLYFDTRFVPKTLDDPLSVLPTPSGDYFLWVQPIGDGLSVWTRSSTVSTLMCSWCQNWCRLLISFHVDQIHVLDAVWF